MLVICRLKKIVVVCCHFHIARHGKRRTKRRGGSFDLFNDKKVAVFTTVFRVTIIKLQ